MFVLEGEWVFDFGFIRFYSVLFGFIRAKTGKLNEFSLSLSYNRVMCAHGCMGSAFV